MTGTRSGERARLLELLDREAALLADFEEQTKLQSGFLLEGDLDALASSLDKRQEIIEKFDGLHQETEVLMQSYNSVQGGDAEINARCAEQKTALQALLQKDGEISAAVRALADEYSKEIRRLGDNRRGLSGYKLSDTGHSRLFDKLT